MDLNSVKIFLSIVENSGFTKASKATKIPVATISRKLSELEKDLSVQLITRTTRNFRLTEQGKYLYNLASRNIENIEIGITNLQNNTEELKGKVRISVPPGVDPFWKIVNTFSQENPLITLEVYSLDRQIDFISDGIDIALRAGKSERTSVISKKIAEYRHVFIINKKYSKKIKTIETIEDLKELQLILWGAGSQHHSIKQEDLRRLPDPKITMNDYYGLKNLVTNGDYFTELPPYMAKELIKDKTVIEIPSIIETKLIPLNVVYPSKTGLSNAARAFIDYCSENVEKFLH